jgi:hypothetical protein
MKNETKTEIETFVLIAIILIATAGFGIYFFQKNKKVTSAPPTQNIEQPAVKEIQPQKSPAPQKTNFGTSVPTDFPTDIPIEKGAKFQQSYSLNYDSQKQLSIVFLSAKTVKENYSLYSDFLKKQNWNVLNTHDDPAVSSLYGTKENNDINVTISNNTSNASTKSQVSVSVLQK